MAEEESNDAFDRIRLMFDGESSMIIDLTSKGAMTASQISKSLHIPRSVCYRKLRRLVEAQLLAEGRRSNPWANGACVTCYTSNIDSAFVALEHGEMRMTLKLKNNERRLCAHLNPTDA